MTPRPGELRLEMLAASVRAPLVLAALGAAVPMLHRTGPTACSQPLAIASTEGIDLPSAHEARDTGDRVAVPDNVLAVLRALETPPTEPWAPIGCNAGAADVTLDLRIFVIDDVGYVQTVDRPLGLSACMTERVYNRIANLMRLPGLAMPGFRQRDALHVSLTIHAQDPDAVGAELVRE